MNPSDQALDLDTELKARFAALPAVVQRAITSADVEAHLRSLSTIHKLHVDQWESLENEVMLTLLGAQRAEDLATNIASQLQLAPEIAQDIAESISREVFDPIRGELERNLAHPEAQEASISTIEGARDSVLAATSAEDKSGTIAATTTPIAIAPATPPQEQPSVTVAAPIPPADYAPGTPSATRKSIESDPYREPIS